MKKKAAIVSLWQTISDSLYSHASGFPHIFQEQLAHSGVDADILYTAEGKPWDKYKMIFIYEGLPFYPFDKRAPNLTGGPNEKAYQQIKKLLAFEGRVFTIDHPMMNYVPQMRRVEWKNWGGFKASELERMEFIQGDSEISSNPGKCECVVVGDSHAPSVWKPGSWLTVNSGLTLFRALDLGLEKFVPWRNVKEVTFYFGNIDLRHHIGRRADGKKAACELACRYADQLFKVADRGAKVFACELLPVEDESRVVPKSGWYKGTPFCGTWDERNSWRSVFMKTLETELVNSGVEIVSHPAEWSDKDGKLNQEFMERPRSVHIAPKYYRHHRLAPTV